MTLPSSKQEVGPMLDKFHKPTSVNDKLSLLDKIEGGFQAYLKVNKDNAEATKVLKLMEKKCKLEREKLIKARAEEANKLKLKDVWEDRNLKELLEEFLKKEWSKENFDFLDAVKTKKSPKLIYATYIEATKTQVNLPYAIKKDLDEQYVDHPDRVNYQDAYEEIWRLVETDSLPRFRKSETLIEAFGEQFKSR